MLHQLARNLKEVEWPSSSSRQSSSSPSSSPRSPKEHESPVHRALPSQLPAHALLLFLLSSWTGPALPSPVNAAHARRSGEQPSSHLSIASRLDGGAKPPKTAYRLHEHRDVEFLLSPLGEGFWVLGVLVTK